MAMLDKHLERLVIIPVNLRHTIIYSASYIYLVVTDSPASCISTFDFFDPSFGRAIDLEMDL